MSALSDALASSQAKAVAALGVEGAVLSDAHPYPKSAQLARGERRYRRKVASPKQWQAIIAAKGTRCRICQLEGLFDPIEYHHLVSRTDHGDDVRDNIVPLHAECHQGLHARRYGYAELLLRRLSDAEYAYMIQRGGEDYPERAYGISYGR